MLQIRTKQKGSNKMTLSKIQKKILKKVKTKLVYGDYETIATNLHFSKEHISRVLSLKNDNYNEAIVNEAARIISERDEATKELLQKI